MVRSNSNAADGGDDHDYNSRRQLALITPPTTAAANITSKNSGFKLPEGWGVEEVPRPGATHVDKYYYEPGTGRKFRSLKGVERHINGEEQQFIAKPRGGTWHNNHERPSSRKMIVSGGKMVRVTEGTLKESQLALATVASSKTAANSPYNLPDGWVVEEVPRSSGSHADKYYHEPQSGRRFRSLLAAQRHVEKLNEDIPLSAFVAEIKDMNRPLSKAFKLPQGVKKSAPCNTKSARNNEQSSSFDTTLPEKVEWVLASPGGDGWKPFVCDRAIPDSLKEQWKKRFVSAMNSDDPDS